MVLHFLLPVNFWVTFGDLHRYLGVHGFKCTQFPDEIRYVQALARVTDAFFDQVGFKNIFNGLLFSKIAT